MKREYLLENQYTELERTYKLKLNNQYIPLNRDILLKYSKMLGEEIDSQDFIHSLQCIYTAIIDELPHSIKEIGTLITNSIIEEMVVMYGEDWEENL